MPNDFATFSRKKKFREIDSRPFIQRNPSHRREIDRHLYHEFRRTRASVKLQALVRNISSNRRTPKKLREIDSRPFLQRSPSHRRKIDRHLYRNFFRQIDELTTLKAILPMLEPTHCTWITITNLTNITPMVLAMKRNTTTIFSQDVL